MATWSTARLGDVREDLRRMTDRATKLAETAAERGESLELAQRRLACALEEKRVAQADRDEGRAGLDTRIRALTKERDDLKKANAALESEKWTIDAAALAKAAAKGRSDAEIIEDLMQRKILTFHEAAAALGRSQRSGGKV